MKDKNYYSIKSSKGNACDNISFYKENGLVHIHMGYEELHFTVKEAKEIADKLKKCANSDNP